MEVKEFVDALERYLVAAGEADRRATLRAVARRLGAEGRAAVADGIGGLSQEGAADGGAPAGGKRPDLGTLLERAAALVGRVEAGEYGFEYGYEEYGYGEYGDYWDDEGFLVDQDGLCPEIKALLQEAVDGIDDGHHALGLAVIDLLADIDVPCDYDGADFVSLLEEGRLGLGRDRVLAPWVAAAFHALEGDERLARVLEVGRRFHWRLPLKKALEAAGAEPEAADRFLGELARRIMAELGQSVPPNPFAFDATELDQLLADAVSLRGRGALREAASRHGQRHPVLYSRLVGELSAAGELEAAVDAAAAALTAVPSARRAERALIADLMFQAAEEAGLADQAAAAAEAGFAAGLDLPRFLRLRRVGSAAAVARGVAALKGAPPRGDDAMAVLFLAGEFQVLWRAVSSDKAALGWSGSDKGAAFPLILALLFEGREWGAVARGLVRAVAEPRGAEVADQFMRAAEEVDTAVPPADLATYRGWCRAEVAGRVDGIVQNQHRGAYARAATLVVAYAEAVAATGGGGDPKPLAYVAGFHERFPKHGAFRRELEAALAKSSLR
ncbi:MAG: hypothetical protein LBC97_04965 [Bifidobacteriaceae bacterium]|jgi:hypothetical protein|nr:hypothetical protein [Bifidobacteriaceae bacterium]